MSAKRSFIETTNNSQNATPNDPDHDTDQDYNSNDLQMTSDGITSSDHSQTQPRNKRLALRQCLVSRYHEEFHEVCKLGNGEFGDVFKCINRLDGCTYAIKRSKKPIAGSALEVAAWKEVCAHAVLVKHSHIVQYYSAWAEADRMLIQNEYCNGGSLAEFIETLKTSYSSPQDPSVSVMNEYDLKLLLLHIAKGLAYMHSLHLVHLDIKPGKNFHLILCLVISVEKLDCSIIYLKNFYGINDFDIISFISIYSNMYRSKPINLDLQFLLIY